MGVLYPCFAAFASRLHNRLEYGGGIFAFLVSYAILMRGFALIMRREFFQEHQDWEESLCWGPREAIPATILKEAKKPAEGLWLQAEIEYIHQMKIFLLSSVLALAPLFGWSSSPGLTCSGGTWHPVQQKDGISTRAGPSYMQAGVRATIYPPCHPKIPCHVV